MSMLFIRHVVGDLTIGKPDLTELYETDSLEAAARSFASSPEASVAVLRRSPVGIPLEGEERFLGLISAMDLVAFLAKSCPAEDQSQREILMKEICVGDVVVRDQAVLKEVDPGTRLIDALDMMKQGVKRLVVRKSPSWVGLSKRFSLLFNGKWLKSPSLSSSPTSSSLPLPSPSFCCISREDMARFLISRLGALAPLPLTSISSLNAISTNYASFDSSAPALHAITKLPLDPCAIAVVETTPEGVKKIIGDISAYKLWKCDYVATAWAMANLSAGEFVVGTDENGEIEGGVSVGTGEKRRFSRSVGCFNNRVEGVGTVGGREGGVCRGRSSPLVCKRESSLAAVMAQMLSYRATHVWVTDESKGGALVGIVGYVDILNAVTKRLPPLPSTS